MLYGRGGDGVGDVNSVTHFALPCSYFIVLAGVEIIIVSEVVRILVSRVPTMEIHPQPGPRRGPWSTLSWKLLPMASNSQIFR